MVWKIIQGSILINTKSFNYRYKSGIFQKSISQIYSSAMDLRLSGIVGIDTDICTFDYEPFFKSNHTSALEKQV